MFSHRKQTNMLLTLFFLAAASAYNIDDFLKSNEHISTHFYKNLLEIHNDSFIACPASLQFAFSLIKVGAEGKTAEQLSTALLLPDNVSVIKEIMEKNLKSTKYTVINILNKIYARENFEIAVGFKDTAVDVFKADIENVDFADKDQAVAKINSWVSTKTNGNIRSAIAKQDISEKTPAVLINTIYFEGQWKDRFTTVTQGEFHVTPHKKITIDVLSQNKQLSYFESSSLDAKFLKLRYTKSEIAMIVVLPGEIDGLGQLEANIEQILHVPTFESRKVHVKLPKFETTNTIDLKPILQKWGVTELFQAQADLKGMGAGKEPFYIGQVLQKNFIRVHENGTSVGSATVATPRLGARRDQSDPKEFIADHPFIYYITSPNGILFLGRFVG